MIQALYQFVSYTHGQLVMKIVYDHHYITSLLYHGDLYKYDCLPTVLLCFSESCIMDTVFTYTRTHP